MAQIIRITSEALQATIRRLLPSQQGFGEDLLASNVVTPIIDLTPTAEGSQLASYLQVARGFDQSKAQANGTTTTVTTTAGFYLCDFIINSGTGTGVIELNDGSTTKELDIVPAARTSIGDYVVFVPTGYTFQIRSNALGTIFTCYSRQIADVNGELNQPFGFSPQ